MHSFFFDLKIVVIEKVPQEGRNWTMRGNQDKEKWRHFRDGRQWRHFENRVPTGLITPKNLTPLFT